MSAYQRKIMKLYLNVLCAEVKLTRVTERMGGLKIELYLIKLL